MGKAYLAVGSRERSLYQSTSHSGKEQRCSGHFSRGGPHAEDWSLNPAIVELLWERFGRARVDLFAAKAHHKCPLGFSMSPSEEPLMGTNALSQERWPEGLLYAYPPYSVLVDLLERFKGENL